MSSANSPDVHDIANAAYSPRYTSVDMHVKHTEIFHSDLGFYIKAKAIFYLNPGVKPIFLPKRPVAYAAVKSLGEEFYRSQLSGVTKPVNHSAWAAPIVVIEKANDSIGLCGDLDACLNACLETCQYPLPIPTDLHSKLNGGKLYSKIDLPNAYFQDEVHEPGKELLATNPNRGAYQ